MISTRYTTTFSIKRMVWYNETSEEQDYLTFKGHLQQTSADMSETLGLAFNTAYTIWCDITTDIKQGDKLKDDKDNEYNVEFVKDLLVGTNKHKQLFVKKILEV